MRQTITFMKYVNQPVMNAAQKMRFKNTNKTKIDIKQANNKKFGVHNIKESSEKAIEVRISPG